MPFFVEDVRAMSNWNPHNARREAIAAASGGMVPPPSRENVVLEARLADALAQRDELLESVELWMDAVEADPQNAHFADEELQSTFRRVRDSVWESS